MTKQYETDKIHQNNTYYWNCYGIQCTFCN